MSILLKSLTGLVALIAMAGAVVFAYLQHPVFGSSPAGERLARIQASPHYRDGRFHNLSATPMLTGSKSFTQALWDSIFHGNQNVRPTKAVPAIKTDLHTLPATGNWLVWLGHSSYLMQVDGKRFLLDPVLVSATPLPFGGKRFAGADVYHPADLPAVDYLIITHDHYDHLDYDTVKTLRGKAGKVIAPLGVGAHFERWGFAPEHILELDWQEQAQLAAGFTLTALPARHSSGRALAQNQTFWASFMLQTPSETIYLGGDSGYDDFFKDIAAQFPRITLAIMENGQYDEDWANIHFLPGDLIRAIKDLQPHTVLTVHHSTFELAKHDWNEPLKLLAQNAQREGIRITIPQIGEVWDVQEKPQRLEVWWD